MDEPELFKGKYAEVVERNSEINAIYLEVHFFGEKMDRYFGGMNVNGIIESANAYAKALEEKASH
jgi:hypothetical protein